MTDVVAVIEKNARERVQIELSRFKGHDLIGIRVYADKGGGEWVATPKGITLRVSHLRDLVGARRPVRPPVRHGTRGCYSHRCQANHKRPDRNA